MLPPRGDDDEINRDIAGCDFVIPTEQLSQGSVPMPPHHKLSSYLTVLSVFALIAVGSFHQQAHAQVMPGGGRLFAIDGSGDNASTLFELNANDGSIINVVGATGESDLTGISFNDAGQLFAVESDLFRSGRANLHTLDLNTGAATLVGPTGEQIPDIAFAPDGTLFGWTEVGTGSDDLIRIDPNTGNVMVTASPLGTLRTGVAVNSMGAVFVKDANQLNTIDPNTGAVLTTINLAGDNDTLSNVLAFDGVDQLYTAERLGGGMGTNIYVVDINTGVTTLIGNTPINSLSSLAFLFQQALADNALTFNQEQVASLIDELNDDGNPIAEVLCDGLQMLNADDQRSAFEELAGEIFASNATIQTEQTTNRNRRVADRLRTATGGNGIVGSSFAPQPEMIAFNDDELVVRGQQTRFRQTWAMLYGYGGDVDSNGNANDTDFNTQGVTLGMESACCGSLVGVFADFGQGSVQTLNGAQQLDTDHQLIGGYVRKTMGQNYLIGIGSWGFDDYLSTRALPLAGVTARAKFQGDQLSLYSEVGRNTAFGPFGVQPYIAGQFVHVHQEGFTEQGAGILSLRVGDENYDSVRSMVGVRTSGTRCTRVGMLTATFRGEWMHEFNDDANLINSNFNVIGGPAFAVQGIDPGNDWLFLGAGLSLQRDPCTRFFINYDAQISDQSLAHLAWAGVEKSW